MSKICLIGSTRFIDRFHELNAALTKQGHLVYSVAAVSSSAGQELEEDVKETLDLVHLLKIQESEVVVVIGAQEDGTYYLGKSTRRELRWAFMLGKTVLAEKAWVYSQERIVPVEETAEMVLTHQFRQGIDEIMKAQVPDPETVELHKKRAEFVKKLQGEHVPGESTEERPN